MQPEYKDDTFWELGRCALNYKIAYFSFYEPFTVSVQRPGSLFSSLCVLLLSFLYSLRRYETLMLLLIIHNITKSVSSGRVHFLIFLLFTIFFIISLLSRRTLSFLAHIHQRSVVSSFLALKAQKINMSITTDLKYVQARHDVRRVPHSFVYHTIFAAN